MKSSVSWPMRNQQPSSQPQTDADEELPADPSEGDSEYSEEEAEADRMYERQMEEARKYESEMNAEFAEAWGKAHREMTEEYRRKVDPLYAELAEKEKKLIKKVSDFANEHSKDDPLYGSYKDDFEYEMELLEDRINSIRREIDAINFQQREIEKEISRQCDW